MTEADVEFNPAAMATGGPIEAVLRPMAKVLAATRPEGAKTVEEPTDEAWGAPRETCTAAADEEGTDEEATAETEEGKDEGCKLESPSMPGCCGEDVVQTNYIRCLLGGRTDKLSLI